MVRLLLAVVVTAVAFFGCSGTTPWSKGGNTTLADFGGKRITLADFESYLVAVLQFLALRVKFTRLNPASVVLRAAAVRHHCRRRGVIAYGDSIATRQ